MARSYKTPSSKRWIVLTIAIVATFLVIIGIILLIQFSFGGCSSCGFAPSSEDPNQRSSVSIVEIVLIQNPDASEIVRDVNLKYAESKGYVRRDAEYAIVMGPNAIVADPSYGFEDITVMMGSADAAVSRATCPRSDKRSLNGEVVVVKTASNVGREVLSRKGDTRAIEEYLTSIIKEDLEDEDRTASTPTQPRNVAKRIESCEPIARGFPLKTKRVMIFNENAFNGRGPFVFDLSDVDPSRRDELAREIANGTVSKTPRRRGSKTISRSNPVFPLDKTSIDIVPWRVPARVSPTKTRKIPYNLFQTFSSCAVLKPMKDVISTWIEKNPDHNYFYYDDADCRSFIVENFDERVLRAYDDLVPGAFKADLWRYCVLYIHGGVYVDAKSACIIPLSEFIDENDECILVIDKQHLTSYNVAQIYNAFLCCVPHHPLLRTTIDEVVELIEKRAYGDNVLDITGPMRLGKIVYRAIGKTDKNRLEPGRYESTFGPIRVLDHKMGEKRKICDEDGRQLIFTRYRGMLFESGLLGNITGRRHYTHYWLRGSVYR